MDTYTLQVRLQGLQGKPVTNADGSVTLEIPASFVAEEVWSAIHDAVKQIPELTDVDRDEVIDELANLIQKRTLMSFFKKNIEII